MTPRVYLAGPDVFFPEPEQWSERKKAICARHGLLGISPMDLPSDVPRSWNALPFWRQLSLRNEAHIRSCQALIANLTPFRGPSADTGTVYEVGFARALGLTIFGYATVAAPFLERTLASIGGSGARPDGSFLDQDGLLVEQFGLYDNLMIEGGIIASGGMLIVADADRWTDLTVFERCVRNVAAALPGAADITPPP